MMNEASEDRHTRGAARPSSFRGRGSGAVNDWALSESRSPKGQGVRHHDDRQSAEHTNETSPAQAPVRKVMYEPADDIRNTQRKFRQVFKPSRRDQEVCVKEGELEAPHKRESMEDSDQKRIEKLSAAVRQLQHQLEVVRKEKEELLAEQYAAKHAHSATQDSDRFKHENQELKSRIRVIEAELLKSSKNQELNLLKDQLKTLENRVKSQADIETNLRKRITDLSGQVRAESDLKLKVESDLKAVQQSNQALTSELSETRQQLQEVTSERDTHFRALKKKRLQVKELESQLEEKSTQLESAVAHVAQLKDHLLNATVMLSSVTV